MMITKIEIQSNDSLKIFYGRLSELQRDSITFFCDIAYESYCHTGNMLKVTLIDTEQQFVFSGKIRVTYNRKTISDARQSVLMVSSKFISLSLFQEKCLSKLVNSENEIPEL